MRAIPENKLVPHPGIQILLFVLLGMVAAQWNLVHAEDNVRSQLADAQAAVRRAVDRYGPNAIETVPSRMALAELHIANGDFPKAEPLLQQALNVSIRVNSTGHKSLLPILERLAWIDIRNNRFASGKQFYSDAIEIARRSNGSNSPIMQKLLDSLADAREKERQAGNLPAVHRKQVPPAQQSADPTYDLVIASQNQPPPPMPAVTTPKNQSGPDKASSDKASSDKASKDAKVSASPSAAIASTPKVAQPVVTENLPAAVTPPPSNSPFLFGVTTPQPVAWQPPPPTPTTTAPVPPEPAPPASAPTPSTTTTSAAPPPEAASPPPPTAKANTDGDTMAHEGWFITTGCFSQTVYVDERLGEIRKLNLPAYAKQNRSGSMTCVYSGPYPEQSKGESALGTIKKHGGMNDAFIRAY